MNIEEWKRWRIDGDKWPTERHHTSLLSYLKAGEKFRQILGSSQVQSGFFWHWRIDVAKFIRD